jgi:hypothetical protein
MNSVDRHAFMRLVSSNMKTKVYERYPAEVSSEHGGFPSVCLSPNACDNAAKLYDISYPGMSVIYARPFYLQLSQRHDRRVILIPYISGPVIACPSFALPRLQWATISTRQIYNLSSSQAQPLFSTACEKLCRSL